MFQIKAQILNTFTVPASETKPEKFKVQLIGDCVTKDGQIRKDMLTLSCPADVYSQLEKRTGQIVTIPVGVFVADGRIQPYFPKQGAGITGEPNA